MTRTGTVPTLLTGAGSAQGRPQAGICCAPVPKKATSGGNRSGSSPTGQHAAAWQAAPQHQPCPALPPAPHTCAATPLQGHPSAQTHGDPRGPTTSLRKCMGSLPPSAPDLPQKKDQDPPTPLSTPQSQTRHQDWPGSTFCTRDRSGTESHQDWLGQTLLQGVSSGLFHEQVLTLDWSMHGFSHEIGQTLDSHLGLVCAWILT